MAVLTLSAAYFTGELFIPNISGSGPAETANAASLDIFIKKYQPAFLKELLGEELYAKYAAAVGATPAPTSGAYYLLNQQIYQTTPVYQSAVANYVYYYFWNSSASLTAGIGEVVPTAENSTVISIRAKVVRAWNEMCELAGKVQDWLDDNQATYPTEFADWNDEDHTVFEEINIYGA